MRQEHSRIRARTALLVGLLLAVGVVACGDDGSGGNGGSGASGGGTGSGAADLPAGATAIVAIVNPVVNDPHNTGVPAELGSDRGGIDVDADPGEADVTSDDGLAVVDVPTGGIDLFVGAAPALAHTVLAEGDIYDAAIGYDGSGAAFFDHTPIRYAVGQGSGAIFYDPDDDFGEIDARLTEDNVIVVLRPGTYTGSLDIRGKNVLLFGEGWSERAVIIDGSVVINGGDVRLRGLTITGNLTSNGNGFGISFSVVEGDTDIKGNGGAFLRNVFCAGASVPSSSATLLDNYGVEPTVSPPPIICD